MILPEKHISMSESTYGFGGEILSLVHGKTSVDEMWELYNKGTYKYKHGFDSFILTLDFLFIIGAIVTDDSGCITLATH
jgi:hypothetical protein